MMRLPLLSVLLALSAVSCAVLDSGYDTKKLPDGRYANLDTPRMWESWKKSVDTEVRREALAQSGAAQNDPLHGAPNGGGTWNEYWLSRIAAVQEAKRQNLQENADKYIDYIGERRREAGLPELVATGG